MNRRDFLKVVTATSAVVAAPSLIPADARLVLDAKNETVIGNITRTIDWHANVDTHFVSYMGRINNVDYYVGDFVEEVDAKTLIECDANAMKAFKRRLDMLRGVESDPVRKITESELRGDFPPYGV